MNVCEWHFVFHQPAGIRDVLKGAKPRTLLQHVEAYGCTRDGTWIFFDPRGEGTLVHVTHHHDEVVALIAARYAISQAIYRIANEPSRIRYPLLFPHLHCITQCSGLLGWRAYTPRGFKAMLLRNGAEIIHDAQRGSRGEAPPSEPAPAG